MIRLIYQMLRYQSEYVGQEWVEWGQAGFCWVSVTVKESTYKELDSQFESGQPNFGNIGDIDLSILTSRLYPEKEVQRCTEIWTMDSLYQDLAKQ